MSYPFISPLFAAGEFLLAVSFTMFVEALILTLGDNTNTR